MVLWFYFKDRFSIERDSILLHLNLEKEKELLYQVQYIIKNEIRTISAMVYPRNITLINLSSPNMTCPVGERIKYLLKPVSP